MAGYSVTYSVVDNATKQLDAINKRIAAMRAPIDRLQRSVTRFMDVSGLKRVADGFRWVGRAAAFAFRSMVAIVPVLGTIVGAATLAGMVRLVSVWSDWGREIATDAGRLGITADKLQVLQDAGRLAGVSANEMTTALRGVADSSRDAMLRGGETATAYNQLGIAIRDANGHLKSADQLLPEVIDKIAQMKNGSDRAHFAQLLLGGSGEKLIETLRAQGISYEEYMRRAEKLPKLTDAQRESLQRMARANASVGVTFDHLGQQISATLANHFAPLIERFDKWVQENTPEIIAAVDKLATKFAKWIEGIDWNKVYNGAKSVGNALKWVVENLDLVLKGAEAVAALFLAKWAIGIVGAIAQVTTAIGVATGIGAAGTGLAGALAAIALIAGAIAGVQNAPMVDEYGRKTGTWGGKDEEPPEPSKVPNDELVTLKTLFSALLSRAWNGPAGLVPGGGGGGGGGGGNPNFTPTAPELTPDARGLLKTIAGDESKGDYNVLYGGGRFTGNAFPQWAGRDNSHAAGAYQFQPGTFAGVQKQRPDITDFNPANQDRAAWHLAQVDYQRRTGRDLTVDLKDPMQHQRIAAVLQPTWTSTNKPGWADRLTKNLQTAQSGPRAPVAAAPGAAPNGQVQISISHANPPPGTTLGASATGNGLNLEPPRTERNMLAGP